MKQKILKHKMDTKNRSKVLLLIIGILLVTNIVLLSFLLTKKETSKQNGRQDKKAYIAAYLKNEVGFDTVQLKEFDTLSTRHQEKMKGMFDKSKTEKGDQFKQLVAGNFTDSVMNEVAEKSGAKQKSIELIMLNHLKNIRLLCKPQQLIILDTSFAKVLNRNRSWSKKK